ncbi:MAG: orotidine-5'-phosphate decarboxylase [Candidatus Daviesbacteria bacterium]|nr:orotidine-5'-phosphate decarboxylase [Candidatus Daviesbacteria bacterium]
MEKVLTAGLSFTEQLQYNWEQGKFVCIGLDADYSKIPAHLVPKLKAQGATNFNIRTEASYEFLRDIVDATADVVCAYKPNSAFFEDKHNSLFALKSIVSYIHKAYPNIPVIGDVKRADIGNTNKGYAKMAFENYDFDAITTNPYLGGDTFGPFTSYKDKGLVILCKTSNTGSKELQDMPINILEARKEGLLDYEEYYELDEILKKASPKVYQMVAFLAAKRWNKSGNLALVVGATHPEAFAPIRKLAGNMPFLIPGIGTQGGDLEKTLKYAPDDKGQGMIINSSSGIIFASKGEDFAEAARTATLKLHNQIRQFMTA